MALETTALATVAEYKDWSSGDVSGTGFDNRIESLLNSSSRLIETETNGYVFVKRDFTERYPAGHLNMFRSGGGAKRLYLRHMPIVAISGIADDEGNVVEPDEYTIVADQGYLEHDSEWPDPEGRWNIPYRAGDSDATADVPSDVKQAVFLLVQRQLKGGSLDVRSRSRSGRAGAKSETLGGAMTASGTLPADARGLLRKYIRHWV